MSLTASQQAVEAYKRFSPLTARSNLYKEHVAALKASPRKFEQLLKEARQDYVNRKLERLLKDEGYSYKRGKVSLYIVDAVWCAVDRPLDPTTEAPALNEIRRLAVKGKATWDDVFRLGLIFWSDPGAGPWIRKLMDSLRNESPK